MPKAIKVKRSRREKIKIIQKWVDKYNVNLSVMNTQAAIKGLGKLGVNDYYRMAIGFNPKMEA